MGGAKAHALAMGVAVDSYGFALVGLSALEAATIGACARLAEKTAKKHDTLFASLQKDADNSTTALLPSLKKLVREGLPHPLRPALWPLLSGASALRAAAPANAFTRLLASSDHPGVLAQVEVDLQRAFPAHPLLATAKGAATLKRVLTAYSRHSAAFAYSTSLLALAAFLLVVLGPEREEDAFWLLVVLFEERLCFAQATRACQVEQETLEALLGAKCPRLLAHLQRLECPFAGLAADWFPALFVTALPAETAARVLDCLFVEGPKVLYRVAIALCKLYEPTLLGIQHGIRVPRVLNWRVARTYNADALLKMAFRGIGSFPSAKLERVRRAKEGLILAEAAAHRQRLDAVLHARPPPSPSALAPVTESDEESSDA